MSFGLDTVLTVVDGINRAVAIYQSIQAVPGEVADLRIQLDELSKPLSSLLSAQDALSRMAKRDRDGLGAVLQSTLLDCGEVEAVFARLESHHMGYIGGVSIKARADWVASAWYRYKVGADKVEKLTARIYQRQVAIQSFLSVVNIKSQEEVQKAIAKNLVEVRRMHREMQKLNDAVLQKDVKEKEALQDRIKRLEALLAKEREEARQAKTRESLVKERRQGGGSTTVVGGGGGGRKEPEVIRGRIKSFQQRLREEQAKSAREKEKKTDGGVKAPQTTEGKDKATDVKTTDSKTSNPSKPKSPSPKPNTPFKQPSPRIIQVDKPDDKKPKIIQVEPKVTPADKPKVIQADKPNIIQVEPRRPKTPDPSSTQKLQVPEKDTKKQPQRASSEPPAPRKSPSPSPSPSPSQRRCYSVVFVDPANVGRSIVAQAILAQIDLRTRAADDKKQQPLLERHSSVGFFVRNGNACVAEIEGLDYATKSYRFDIRDMGSLVNNAALDALFGRQEGRQGGGGCNGPEAELEKTLRFRSPTGPQRSLFAMYDYVVCFTLREQDNLGRLKKAIAAKDGDGACPQGKGKIVNLGRYLSKDGSGATAREILSVGNMDCGEDGDAWRKTIEQMRVAVGGFLKREVKWEPV